ncbi:MAG: electron transport complex subunit RsxG [Proteobacteria bacterium]|nr:MAG: electron transport complex subunit RsxG [Pseudomonadota bacterium]
MSEIRQAITKSVIGLATFSIVTTALITATYLLTFDRIEQQRKIAESRALRDIFPNHYHDNEFLDDRVNLPDSAVLGKQSQKAFVSRKQGRINGVLIPATAPQGYGGEIRLISGIDSAGTIAGVRVLAHRETPGLGDKIELRKSDWIQQFTGKSLGNPAPEGWRVIKAGGEFDQLTGATITSRAVIKAVYNTLDYFNRNRDYLLKGTGGGKHGDNHSEQ